MMPASTGIGQIGADYTHYAKRAEFREMLGLASAELKFYHLAKASEPVPAWVDEAARLLAANGVADALGSGDEHGLLILHRCGATFHFLLLGLWRGTNELWEAVYYLDAGMTAFAPFEPAYERPLRPTFCVWELGIVAHESGAWTRFLASPRDEADLERWRLDVLNGEI